MSVVFGMSIRDENQSVYKLLMLSATEWTQQRQAARGLRREVLGEPSAGVIPSAGGRSFGRRSRGTPITKHPSRIGVLRLRPRRAALRITPINGRGTRSYG